MAKGRVIFLDEHKQIGHIRMREELVAELDVLSKAAGMSRSSYIRRYSEAFVLYMNDARAFKKLTFFGKKPTIETWLNERNDIREMTEQVQQYADKIQIAKTPDEKIQLVAAQNVLVANMINLLHKTTMT